MSYKKLYISIRNLKQISGWFNWLNVLVTNYVREKQIARTLQCCSNELLKFISRFYKILWSCSTIESRTVEKIQLFLVVKQVPVSRFIPGFTLKCCIITVIKCGCKYIYIYIYNYHINIKNYSNHYLSL